MDLPGSRRSSKVWKHFTVKDDYIATCKVCNNDYSYKTTVANLNKHWRRKHADYNYIDYSTDTSNDCSYHSDDNSKEKPLKNGTESKSTWQYFDILDSDKFVAKCKLCEKDISYESVLELTNHIKEHDVIVSDDEHLDLTTESKKPKVNSKRKPSPLWQYMRPVEGKCAECQICMKKLSYAAGTSNLTKHLKRSHRELKYGSAESEHKVLISANGQIYEVQTSDVEKDPIDTNEIYLESDFGTDNNATTKRETPVKKKFKKFKQINKSRRRSNSSDEDVPAVKKNNKNDPLDFFGPYIVSMLKQLPKQVSEQLQIEIVKQIITAKVALYSHSSSLDGPVTVTINNGTANTTPEVTVTNVADVEMTDHKIECNIENDI